MTKGKSFHQRAKSNKVARVQDARNQARLYHRLQEVKGLVERFW